MSDASGKNSYIISPHNLQAELGAAQIYLNTEANLKNCDLLINAID